MSEENAATPPDVSSPSSKSPAEALEDKHPAHAKTIYLISYPKIVFLYPTFFTALLAGLIIWWGGEVNEKTNVAAAAETSVDKNADAESKTSDVPASHLQVTHSRTQEVATLLFLGVLTLNLCVVTFDFPRTTSLTLFFFIAMLVMGCFLTFTYKPDLVPAIGEFFQHLKPWANAQFFFLIAAILFCFYLAVLVAVRYDYWEVRPNELLHHHGFLSDLKRYPAPNLRIDKEINDVFEYMLLRSGRLILHARHETRAIVLDNVLFINHKEQLLTKMLGALQVSVRDDE
tara:strand:- start:101609 stop:102469 length:861 start_codon:yes stop_codon:yes gene_type:complete